MAICYAENNIITLIKCIQTYSTSLLLRNQKSFILHPIQILCVPPVFQSKYKNREHLFLLLSQSFFFLALEFPTIMNSFQYSSEKCQSYGILNIFACNQ